MCGDLKPIEIGLLLLEKFPEKTQVNFVILGDSGETVTHTFLKQNSFEDDLTTNFWQCYCRYLSFCPSARKIDWIFVFCELKSIKSSRQQVVLAYLTFFTKNGTKSKTKPWWLVKFLIKRRVTPT